MPVLHISRGIADAHCDDISTVLGQDIPMPALDAKDLLQLTYTGDDPERRAAFRRLQELPGVIAEY
jgi:hypothetical protein